MIDLWRDFWIRETEKGQQVAVLHERHMAMMMNLLETSRASSGLYKDCFTFYPLAGIYSPEVSRQKREAEFVHHLTPRTLYSLVTYYVNDMYMS